jgi:hypothetical protein
MLVSEIGMKGGDRPLVPLDNNIGDLDVSEDVEDVWHGITNGLSIGGVGANGDPHNNRAESFVLAVLNCYDFNFSDRLRVTAVS